LINNNTKTEKEMNFNVTTDQELMSFKIELEGQTYIVYPKNEVLFDYLIDSSKSDWKQYINRNPTNLKINKL
jgi:Tfp pilus assembly PilM family ATPase